MDISVNESQNVFRPIICVIYIFALLPVVFRLIYRTWAQQLWWDDLWAFFSMINAAVLFGIYILSSLHLQDTESESYTNTIYIMTLLTANLALWCARLSVAVTIVRVVATGTIQLLSKIIAAMFGLFSITLFTQKIVICGPPSSAKFLCSNPAVTGYTELAFSLFADLWLLSAPAYLLWKMKLRKKHHRLLQAIFACEILVLAASVTHSVYLVKKTYLLQALTAHFEIGISLIVCNLLFLTTYIYRIFRRGEDYEESTISAPRRPESQLPIRSSIINPRRSPMSSLTVVSVNDSSNSRDPESIVFMSHPGGQLERPCSILARNHAHHSI